MTIEFVLGVTALFAIGLARQPILPPYHPLFVEEDDDDEPTGLAAMDLAVEDDGY